FSEVMRRHEALRTVFRAAPQTGEPVKTIIPIGPASRVEPPVVDLAALPERVRGEEAARIASAEARRPFDLSGLNGEALLRTTVLRQGPERFTVLVMMHHIVSDGWSLGVLVRELGALYAAFSEGRPSPLPELAVQYADFAAWQRRQLSAEWLEPELAWWRGQLAGMPLALDLMSDRPRPATLGTRGAEHHFALDGEALAGLNRLSRRHGATLFMTLLAGFTSLLHRFTGQDDLAVATPVAGRTRVEAEPLIGLFVNTLVLRADLTGDLSFAALLGHLRETTLAAYAHQDVPFERLVEELMPERDLSRPALAQVMLSVQNTPGGVLTAQGLELRTVPIATGTAKLELSMDFAETPDGLAGLSGVIEYNTDLFERETIERLERCFTRLLAAAVEAPETRLGDLALLSDDERRELLAAWQTPRAAVLDRLSLDALFARQAERTPEAVAAVSAQGDELTYAELDARIERLARHLRACGAGPEEIVGVCLEPSLDLVAALFAVWRAGSAFLPLDPAYPADRLAFMLEDSGAPLLLTRRGLELQPPRGIRTVFLDEIGPEPDLSGLPASNLEDLAYVIYTSGSTGRPKGVAIQHGEAAGHLRTVTEVWELTSGDRVLQFASPSFDVWLEETVPALISGGTVVVRGTELWEPARLLATIERLGITVAGLPTAYWQQWVHALSTVEVIESVTVCRRLVGVGGEAVSAEVARLWSRSALRGVRLLNGYGPTEAVVTATFEDVGIPRKTATS